MISDIFRWQMKRHFLCYENGTIFPIGKLHINFHLNTLIKLLIEEPLKLERLILLFLKFILTLGMFEPLFSCDSLINQVFYDDFKFWNFTGELIKYISLFICWWFIVWTLFAEMLLGLAVRILSRFFKPENEIGDMLKVVDLLYHKPVTKKHINYSIMIFEEILKDQEGKGGLSVSDFRIDRYFNVFAVTTLFFLVSERIELSAWQTFLWWIAGLNLTFGYAYVHRFFKYFNSRFHDLKVEAHKFAYIERARLALSNIQHFPKFFEINHRPRNIRLERKVADITKELIRIIPIYASNSPIVQEMAASRLQRMASSNSKNYLSVILTNVPINVTEATLRQANSTIIVAQDESEMKEGLEIFFSLYLKQIHALSLLEKTPDTNS